MRRSTLPPSYLAKEHALDVLRGAIFEKHLSVMPRVALECLNPKECNAEMLDTLALFYSVDFYRNDFLEEDKRALIFSSIELKKIKGTVGALKKVFASLDIEIDVEEWFEYGGEPFRFKLDFALKSKEITPQLLDTLTRMVHEYKNVRSVMEEIVLAYTSRQSLFVATGAVGESSVGSEMLEGYTETLAGVQNISVGAAGEVAFYAEMYPHLAFRQRGIGIHSAKKE